MYKGRFIKESEKRKLRGSKEVEEMKEGRKEGQRDERRYTPKEGRKE